MSLDLNEVTLIGNVGKDPELRHLQNGSEVVSFSVATNRRWRDKATNEEKSETQWHQVHSFQENVVKVATSYVKKGTRVFVRGQIKYRKYQDRETGADRYVTEIVIPPFSGQLIVLSGGQSAPHQQTMDPNAAGARTPAQRAATPATAAQSSAFYDDDIPF